MADEVTYSPIYSPYELPASTAAAQAFQDINPEAVDTSLQLPPEQQAQAQASIQDHVDQMAAMGVTVTDPRLAPPLSNPVATSCTPSGGPVAGGTSVQINGTGFTGANYVDFGGSPCGPQGKDFVVVDDTLITCQSPPHAAGAVYLTISNPEYNYGSDNPVFTYA